MGKQKERAFPGYVCPSCGVLVLSEAAVAVPHDHHDEPLCVICAPYDPAREGIAIILLSDAIDECCKPKASLGAERRDPKRVTFSQVIFEPKELQRAIQVNEFSKDILDSFFGDAPPRSAKANARDASKQIMDEANTILAQYSQDPSRIGSVILPDELATRYIAVMHFLHDNYVPAHRRYLESKEDLEQARLNSYSNFWHIGSLIRTGRMASRPSPWVTGEERPRF